MKETGECVAGQGSSVRKVGRAALQTLTHANMRAQELLLATAAWCNATPVTSGCSPLLVGARRLHKHAAGGVGVALHQARRAVQRRQAAIQR